MMKYIFALLLVNCTFNEANRYEKLVHAQNWCYKLYDCHIISVPDRIECVEGVFKGLMDQSVNKEDLDRFDKEFTQSDCKTVSKLVLGTK